MGDLGEFGAAVKELTGERDRFRFFGQRFEIVGAIPPILMLQLAASATGKIDDTEGLAAIWETLHHCLDEQAEGGVRQFDRFYRLAVENRCDLDGLMRLVFALFEAQSGRPTEEPSGSSPGQSTTSPSSSPSSSARGRHLWPAEYRPVSEMLAG